MEKRDNKSSVTVSRVTKNGLVDDKKYCNSLENVCVSYVLPERFQDFYRYFFNLV